MLLRETFADEAIADEDARRELSEVVLCILFGKMNVKGKDGLKGRRRTVLRFMTDTFKSDEIGAIVQLVTSSMKEAIDDFESKLEVGFDVFSNPVLLSRTSADQMTRHEWIFLLFPLQQGAIGEDALSIQLDTNSRILSGVLHTAEDVAVEMGTVVDSNSWLRLLNTAGLIFCAAHSDGLSSNERTRKDLRSLSANILSEMLPERPSFGVSKRPFLLDCFLFAPHYLSFPSSRPQPQQPT